MIGIIDCNNFYVSCERVFNPKLLNKPVVVLSNNDGCVISRSQEAKDLGILMGEPAFKREDFFKKNNVIALSANFELYADMSKRVMNIISETAPHTEIYSIDEAFIDLSEIPAPEIETFAGQLKQKIFRWTGIPVSIGLAATKTLAKVAVHHAKKQNLGVLLLKDPEQIRQILRATKIDDIWGIGRRLAKKLTENLFITNALQITETPDYLLRKTGNVNLLRTKKELQGLQAFKFNEFEETKKSLRTSRTFGKAIKDIKTLEEAFAFFADNVASKLRKHKLVAKFLTVYLRTNYHSDLPQYSQAAVVSLPTPSNSSLLLVKATLQALRSIFKEGYFYKKGSVTASGLESEKAYQPDLFSLNTIADKKLMKTIDKLKKTYGKKIIRFGIQDNLNDWKSIQKHLSKPFTTDWNSLLEIK